MTIPLRILGKKYQLIRPLSQGGMGSVWLAEHLSLASPVAVKLMAPELGASEELRQRFLHEAHAAAALRSPHVVQTLDYGVDGDTPYIVMELLEGESLAERLGRRGLLSPRETELVLRHVSRAVARAHEQGIVHRDLKPANIFITRDEDEELIKLFDFGIAKAMTLGADTAAQTRTGSLLGTPAYMSPEQLEGSKDCDLRVDIWAMGVIAYECLLGKPPFTGNGLGGLVRAVLSGPLPVPSQQAPGVPAGFDAWFARACARLPAERFASAREAALELRRVLLPELDGVDADTAATDGAAGSAPANDPLDATEPAEQAFPLRPRDRSCTGQPSSATIGGAARRAGWRREWRQGRLPFVPALAVTSALLVLLAGHRLLREPDGGGRLVTQDRALRPGTEGVRSDPARATRAEPSGSSSLAGAVAGAVPGRPRAVAAQAKAPGARVPSGAVPSDAVPSPAVPSRAAPERAAPERAAASRSGASQAGSAALTVTSTPSSHVLIDGRPHGATPLHSVRIKPGTHRVTLIRGKQRKTLYVEASAGENTLLSARFTEPEVVAAQELEGSPENAL